MDAAQKLQSLNNGFGPICQRRGRRKTYASVFVLLAFIIGVLFYRVVKTEKKFNLSDVGLFCGIISAVMLGEIIRRVCLYAEEMCHVDNRYMGSKLKAMKACLSIPNQFQVVAFIFLSISIPVWLVCGTESCPVSSYVTCALIGAIGTNLLNTNLLTKVELSDLNETENKHVSDGFAWCFYFGYLKLIFPEWDAVINNAQGPGYQINGKDARDVLSDKRLYIVIPKNCFCPKNFEGIDQRIQFEITMHERHITRGGVYERGYKNSVYSVHLDGKEPIYVQLEYATPVMSMHEMSENAEAAFSEENRDEQVVEFYSKLSQILERDAECKDKYQLILTDGSSKLAESIYESVNAFRIDNYEE